MATSEGNGVAEAKLRSLLRSSGAPSTLAALPKGKCPKAGTGDWRYVRAAAKDRSANHRETYVTRLRHSPGQEVGPNKLRCFRCASAPQLQCHKP